MKPILTSNLGGLAALLVVFFTLSGRAQAPAPNLDQAFDKLKTYDEGQNNQALVAIEQHVGRISSDPAQRQQMARRLAAILADAQTTAAAKLFICQQLRLVADAEEVPLLARMLVEPATAEMARLVLQPMAAPAAGRVLIEALDQTKGVVLVGVINSLGARREHAAVTRLTKLLADTDASVAGAAALALGKIATPEAADALARSTLPAGLVLAVAEAQLVCAQRLVEEGRAGRAQPIYQKLWTADQPPAVRMAALAGLAKAAPAGALPEILQALNSTEPRLQGLAADLARQLPGADVTAALNQQAAKLEGGPRILLLGALAERGDEAALKSLSTVAAVGDRGEAALRADATRELRRLRHVTRNVAMQESLDSILKDAGSAIATLSPVPYGDEVIEQRKKQIGSGLAAGDALACYLDCGVEARAQATSGISLRQVNGGTYLFPESEKAAAGPLGTLAYNWNQMDFELAGLDPQKHYAMGFSWWDYDCGGRAQSISFSATGGGRRTQVLPSTKLPCYMTAKELPVSGILPIDSSLIAGGKLRVSFANQSGPNAVVSELWLVETKPGSPAAVQVRLAGAAVAPAPAAAVNLDPPTEGTRVLLVTGIDYPGHPWRQTAPVLKKLLEEDPRLKVRIVEDPNVLASPRLKEWDVVILHFMNWEVPGPGPAARNNLTNFVASGKGMMMTHFACGAWHKEWPEFKNLAGRIWFGADGGRQHDPHGKFTVEIADPDHPITKGLQPFETLDELYTCLTGDAPIHVVAKAKSKVDGKDYPMGFVLDYGKGRVFQTVLGHDARAYASPGVAELLRHACAWAAGLK